MKKLTGLALLMFLVAGNAAYAFPARVCAMPGMEAGMSSARECCVAMAAASCGHCKITQAPKGVDADRASARFETVKPALSSQAVIVETVPASTHAEPPSSSDESPPQKIYKRNSSFRI